ncbi:hypothetical protein [Methylobacterium indicum]|uniref:Uncharacterized protein n=1 Tax=Methylobacterium indicum TaxID=1775910 RepID=A0A8H8WTN3_9HYPH|nr:hypothetical protein [Methylobacterium indicum]BCM84058.1 hypothetical protein mvi_25190 [Methylobacterium indicum]
MVAVPADDRSDAVTAPRTAEARPTPIERMIPAIMDRAAEMGLLNAETHQVGARLPVRLLEQAKRRTGIGSTNDLLAFALANVAVDDDFAAVFARARGTLDPDLDIGV